MADVLSPVQRRFCMSRIRGSNTKPELALRKSLFALNLRYRLQSNLPGRPDIIFRKEKIAVFVDGCFWHGCPQHSKIPATNMEFWKRKIEGNINRDKITNEKLRAIGWKPIRVWEHEIKKGLLAVTENIWNKVQKKRKVF